MYSNVLFCVYITVKDTKSALKWKIESIGPAWYKYSYLFCDSALLFACVSNTLNRCHWQKIFIEVCVFGVFESGLSYFDKKIQKCPQTCLRNTKRAKQSQTDEQDFCHVQIFSNKW